ncbi:small integral membrane protein 38 isoform X1 [Agelaius phoeniceus]|uniref:small integral membrane protein 38 isoform X1 n=1 Tax=Agelaius phoeniceus TaxID=39638 RepID=UPI004054B7AF
MYRCFERNPGSVSWKCRNPPQVFKPLHLCSAQAHKSSINAECTQPCLAGQDKTREEETLDNKINNSELLISLANTCNSSLLPLVDILTFECVENAGEKKKAPPVLFPAKTILKSSLDSAGLLK